MTLVVTAIYGGFDSLHSQRPQDVDCEWVCFTDDPNLEAPEPWQVIVEPARYPHPCLAAKYHKCLPPPGDDVVWQDANLQIISRSFIRIALRSRHDGIAVWKHPRRDDIYEEAEASIGSEGQGGKYDGQPILAQVEHYRAEGHPEHGGLYACGTVAWGPDRTLGAAWLDECVRWSFQDQLSLPALCRRAGVVPGVFPARQIEGRRRGWLQNRYLRILPHQSSSRSPATDVPATTVGGG